MCEVISFYIGWNGEIYAGDFASHTSAEDAHGLGDLLRGPRPPVPAEWTRDDGESLVVLVPDGLPDGRDPSWYRAAILGRYASRAELVYDHLARNPEVKGDLDLKGITGLTSLPVGLSVGGWLALTGCTGLTSLPNGLSVGGDLFLTDCTRLKSLPVGLRVGDWLDLAGCTGLTSLPNGLSVGGWLFLTGCAGLKSLPDDLRVGGSLALSGCTRLTSLPDGLSVGWNLDLTGCTGLKSLPDGLSVEWNLDLTGCTGLKSLPDDLRVRGKIYGFTDEQPAQKRKTEDQKTIDRLEAELAELRKASIRLIIDRKLQEGTCDTR